ncbi:hypothetical protein IU500_18490 [Nocardia terpenica]|uniref:hypothetical protein n=1 Tax=Nocardia terpenica TaxID=455432 RepID=UPI001895CE26|nr:hypothetical protein [Nocardia terpenica]MBF6063475.1 hypothetical protein [Nocardia terpenica]MBF6106031.1 hypothetical protein [Nocardia terpenica]MBF6113384.1 hypothetical protein [Nocardia terpenica]MBF6119772.1 hypothetical protein [Nocardia terpenica]MBF6152183.1 hypothetical protein [Nocardia terpenica]
MPHPDTTDTEQGWGWLDATATPPILLHASTGAPAQDPSPDDAWNWLTTAAPEPPTDTGDAPRNSRLPRRGWIALSAALAVTATMVTVGALMVHPGGQPVVPSVTAAPPTLSAVPAVAAACAGLSGTVTDGAGSTDTPAGVIAAFEYAYYTRRSADAAMAVLAPEAGIQAQALAAGIASIPAGSTHCVAVTPLAEGAESVHLVEVHPDRTRVDYLQTINTRTDNGRVLITNIQKQQA